MVKQAMHTAQEAQTPPSSLHRALCVASSVIGKASVVVIKMAKSSSYTKLKTLKKPANKNSRNRVYLMLWWKGYHTKC